MSDPYTPLFKDILLSTVWLESSDTRIVWITMMAMADPDGYVPGSIPGIAKVAGVSVDAVRLALKVFEAPDPESRTTDFEGRRIERRERGWLLLTYRAHRKRAQLAAQRYRKTEWQHNRRHSVDARGRGEDENAPTQTETQTQTSPSEGGSPLPPVESKARAASGGPCPCGDQDHPGHPVGWCAAQDGLRPLQGSPGVWFTLEGWEPSEGLKAEAQLAGVPPEVFEERLAGLRNGPIGGRRGIIDRTAYVRSQFPKWRAWHEEQRARAQSVPHRSAGLPAPAGARANGWGRHLPLAEQEFCQKHQLDAATEVRDFLATGAADTVTHEEADRLFRKHLTTRARVKGGKRREASP